MANANPRERVVRVVGVVPRFEPFREYRLTRRFTCDIEKWPRDKPVEFNHSAKAPWTTSSCKSEQNRFRLIVSGVPSQNQRGAVPFRGLAKRTVAGVTSGRFGTALGTNRHPRDVDRAHPQPRCRRRHRRRDLSTSRLKPVIHDDCPGTKTPFGRDKPSRGGERKGVGPTA